MEPRTLSCPHPCPLNHASLSRSAQNFSGSDTSAPLRVARFKLCSTSTATSSTRVQVARAAGELQPEEAGELHREHPRWRRRWPTTQNHCPNTVAATLLLLYAQPLVGSTTLKTTDVIVSVDELRIFLGIDPAPIPGPFANLLRQHLRNRLNLRTAGGSGSPCLLPGHHAGKHLDAKSIMQRLRKLDINLRVRATPRRNLVAEVPPPLVAEMLGYSYQVTQCHAELAGQRWSQYGA